MTPRKIGLIAAAFFVGIAAIGALWSVDYALAYLVVYRRFDMLHALLGDSDWLLPAEQVWANFGRSELSRLVNLSILALLVEVAGVSGGVGYLVSERRRNLGPAGGAKFADIAALAKAGLLHGAPGTSILLGRFEGKEVRYSGDSHILVNGPTRSGKGRGFIMPNLLEWRGSVIVLDMKLENFKLTGPTRLAMGQQVIVVAPGSQRSHCWNPLDFVRPWPTRPTDVMNLAAALIEEPDRGEKFWAQTARGLLAGLIAYVLETPTMDGRRSMRSVQRLLSTEAGLPATLKAILELEPNLTSFIVESFRGFLGSDEKQRKSFETSVDTALKAWSNPLIAAMTAKSDFDIRDFRRKGMSVFIASPVSDFATMEPVIRLFIQQIHDLALRELPKADETLKVLLMLDEFYQFKRLPEVVLRAPLVGGYGLKIAVMSQNLAQIDERYSKVTREAFLGNMDVKLFIAANDDTTAESISRDLGRRFDRRVSVSERGGLGATKSVTRSTGWVETHLLSASNIKQLSDEKTLLLVRGHPGAILDKMNFYTDRDCRSVVERDAPLQAIVQVPTLEETPEWPLFRLAPEGVVVAKGALDDPCKKSPSPVDKRHDALWAEIRTAAKDVFLEPTRFLRDLATAIDAVESRPVVEIAQALRIAPAMCGALRGEKSSIRAALRRERTAAMSASLRLRRAILNLRIHVDQERFRGASPGEWLKTPAHLVIQTSATESPSPIRPDSVEDGSTPRDRDTAPVGAVINDAETPSAALAATFNADIDRNLKELFCSTHDRETHARIAEMRDRIRHKVAAFAGDADMTDFVPDKLMSGSADGGPVKSSASRVRPVRMT